MKPLVELPPEAAAMKERNLKYTAVLMESLMAGKKDRERMRQELHMAPTPKEVIYQESSISLYRFTPACRKLHPVPLLIIPSKLLRYYILDLMKGHSLIEHLVASGIDTYLLDWGSPGDEVGGLTFDYYVDTLMRRCVRQVIRKTGSPRIHMLGQCLGGVFSVVYASLYPEQIQRLVCLTTPVDFRDSGILSLWTQQENFDVDRLVDAHGATLPAEIIHAAFPYLDVKATVEKYKKLYHNVLNEDFLYQYKTLDHWLNDKIPFPGEVFRKFIGDLYQRNMLFEGTFTIHGRVADLKNITCPVLNIAAAQDHIFPEKTVAALNGMVGGDVEYHLVPAGHVTIVVLFPVRTDTYRLITDFIGN